MCNLVQPFKDMPTPDQLRTEAASVVKTLQQRGISVELLSGDTAGVVSRVADDLGIKQWHAAAIIPRCCRVFTTEAASVRNWSSSSNQANGLSLPLSRSHCLAASGGDSAVSGALNDGVPIR
jgi:magnesium-transporting ATPase (P-type)